MVKIGQKKKQVVMLKRAAINEGRGVRKQEMDIALYAKRESVGFHLPILLSADTELSCDVCHFV